MKLETSLKYIFGTALPLSIGTCITSSDNQRYYTRILEQRHEYTLEGLNSSLKMRRYHEIANKVSFTTAWVSAAGLLTLCFPTNPSRNE